LFPNFIPNPRITDQLTFNLSWSRYRADKCMLLLEQNWKCWTGERAKWKTQTWYYIIQNGN